MKKLIVITLVAFHSALAMCQITGAQLSGASFGSPAGGGGSGYSANSANFDGSSQWLNHSPSAIGSPNSKVLTCSIWIRPTDANSRAVIGLGDIGVFSIFRFGSGTLSISARDASANPIMAVNTALTIPNSGSWYNLIISCDLSDPTKRWVYINDTLDASASWVNYTNANIAWTYSSVSGIAANAVGGSKFGGCLAEVYLCITQSLDLSVTANRRLFIDANGHPANDLLSNGAPSPVIYLKDTFSNFGHNFGSMGDFSIASGPLTSCTTP